MGGFLSACLVGRETYPSYIVASLDWNKALRLGYTHIQWTEMALVAKRAWQ